MLVGALVASQLAGCAECDAGETRCEGETLEVCDGDGAWQPLLPCAEWGDACCALPDGGADCRAVCP